MNVPLTVGDFLRRAALVYPDRVAIVDEPDQPAESWGSITYAQMAERAEAMSAGLDGLGIDIGERVAIVSQNSARLLTALFGVSGHGRVLVPVNFRLSAAEVGYIIEHSGARLLLVDPEVAEPLAGVDCEQTMVLGAESDGVLMRFDAEPRTWVADENATATINYTSGTTARPKGVELTHRNLWLNATVFGWEIGVNDRDVYLHTLPQFHCNGWGVGYAATGMGVPHVILRKIDGGEILRRVAAHGVTLLCGAPAVLAAVLAAAPEWVERTGRAVPGQGRVRVVVAGAPPPTRTIERTETELGWEFIQIYGLTETAPLLTINRRRAEYDDLSPASRAAKLGRAGGPVVGCIMAVDDAGEILARGNMVMDGYWSDPAATDAAISDGFFRTGDGGRIDDEQYLVISDRKKDVIISGGENVSSIEVEDAILQHPDVSEVAVIGVPDDRWGELVMALVVTFPECALTERAVIDFARERLAGFKCPKRVEFRDELPRTATGKLQKYKLREPYWRDADRQVH